MAKRLGGHDPALPSTICALLMAWSGRNRVGQVVRTRSQRSFNICILAPVGGSRHWRRVWYWLRDHQATRCAYTLHWPWQWLFPTSPHFALVFLSRVIRPLHQSCIITILRFSCKQLSLHADSGKILRLLPRHIADMHITIALRDPLTRLGPSVVSKGTAAQYHEKSFRLA